MLGFGFNKVKGLGDGNLFETIDVFRLGYVKDFQEKNIPTKARPIQMSQELMDTCKAEIEDLLKKGIIRNSRSPWSCPAFYV